MAGESSFLGRGEMRRAGRGLARELLVGSDPATRPHPLALSLAKFALHCESERIGTSGGEKAVGGEVSRCLLLDENRNAMLGAVVVIEKEEELLTEESSSSADGEAIFEDAGAEDVGRARVPLDVRTALDVFDESLRSGSMAEGKESERCVPSQRSSSWGRRSGHDRMSDP